MRHAWPTKICGPPTKPITVFTHDKVETTSTRQVTKTNRTVECEIVDAGTRKRGVVRYWDNEIRKLVTAMADDVPHLRGSCAKDFKNATVAERTRLSRLIMTIDDVPDSMNLLADHQSLGSRRILVVYAISRTLTAGIDPRQEPGQVEHMQHVVAVHNQVLEKAATALLLLWGCRCR